MLGGILVIIFSGFISFAIVDRLKKRYPFIDAAYLKRLFFYHLLLFLAYYGYVSVNSSDSTYYYWKVMNDYRGPTWSSFYATSTRFIEFVGYPFIRFLGFSYEAIMALFSLLGYLGFVYFYVFFKENIRFKHTFWKYDLIHLFFLLPNLHFWSSSFGKGSIIFFGLGLFFYGLSKIRTRMLALIIGGVIIYHVRPHIMLVVLVSSAVGFVFSSKGIPVTWRVVFLTGALVAFFFIYQDVLKMVGIDEENPVGQSLDLTHRASELAKATSGVDITSYNLAFQVFTFLYRPLFVDAPGALGFFVSFENVFYLIISLSLLGRLKGWKFLLTGNFLIKSCFLSFLTISIALAQVSGNLGLAIRQKSQVMLLFMFVIIAFLDEQKLLTWRKRKAHKARQEEIQKLRQIAEAQRLSQS